MSKFTLLAQSSSDTAGLAFGSLVILGVALVALIAVIAGWWKVFSKAGYPGWLAIIPIVNVFVYVLIGGKPWWWVILLLIPIVNIVVVFLVHLGVAENYGMGIGFAIGLFLLSPIFILILGLGDYQYIGGKKPKF